MELLFITGAYLIGFILVIVSVPPIVNVAHTKHLFDSINERKIHTGAVPPLGGVAIFIGFTISSIIATDGLIFDSLKYIIAAVVIMFLIGLKDDLIDISAKKKLMIQLFATIILVGLGNIRFTNLHGIMGIHEINYYSSFILSIFVMLVIINAFNLVDGIDGLASGLAMLCASVFGIWFYLSGHYHLTIISFALVGSLSAYFLYNVFGTTNKIFMGDTGSLIIGVIISVLVIYFNELNIDKTQPFAIGAAPAVSFAIIIVPLIDVLRVMAIRIIQKRSPFSPDKNHVHHRLLLLYGNHLKVSSIIVFANICVVLFALALNHFVVSVNLQFILIFLLGVLLSQIPSLLLRIRKEKNKPRRQLQF